MLLIDGVGSAAAKFQFLDAANRVIFAPGVAYIQVQLDRGECADCAWLLRMEDGNTFLLFIDCKSKQVKSLAPAAPAAPEEHPQQGEQAIHFLSLINTALTMFRDDEVVENSLLDTIRSGRVLYVYLDTGGDTYGVGDSILHMGEEDSTAFLSFFNDFYRLHRASSTSSKEEEEEVSRPKPLGLPKKK